MAMSTLNADAINIEAYNEIAGNLNSTQLQIHFHQNAAIPGPSSPTQCPCFNDAPLDLLSVNFTGREQEIVLIIEFLETVYGDVPTRCALHGMHGVGKSQVSNALVKELHNKGRYTNVIWMQATTI